MLITVKTTVISKICQYKIGYPLIFKMLHFWFIQILINQLSLSVSTDSGKQGFTVLYFEHCIILHHAGHITNGSVYY